MWRLILGYTGNHRYKSLAIYNGNQQKFEVESSHVNFCYFNELHLWDHMIFSMYFIFYWYWHTILLTLMFITVYKCTNKTRVLKITLFQQKKILLLVVRIFVSEWNSVEYLNCRVIGNREEICNWKSSSHHCDKENKLLTKPGRIYMFLYYTL